MFKLRVILHHIIKLYQYKQINIEKRIFIKEVQIAFCTHSHAQPETMGSRKYGMPMNEFDDVPAVTGIVTGFP